MCGGGGIIFFFTGWFVCPRDGLSHSFHLPCKVKMGPNFLMLMHGTISL